jgi:hypothetical protein
VRVLGVTTNSAARRRRRLLTTVEAAVFATNPQLAGIMDLNATLYRAIADGSLATRLQSAGVSTTSGIAFASPPASGAEFHFVIQSPASGVGPDGVAVPGVAALQQALSSVGEAATLLADLNSAGLGLITDTAITLTPVIGACVRACVSVRISCARQACTHDCTVGC